MQTDRVLEMNGIVKAFPGVLALDNVNFSLKRGEIHGLVGINGAGKSTLIKILAGTYTKTSGEIILEGCPIEIKGTMHARKLGLAFVHQEIDLVEHFTVAENLLLGVEPKRGPLINWRELIRQAEDVLKRLGIPIKAHTIVKELSAAQRQMVAIARTLIGDSKIIVFDEPTSRLEGAESERLFELIRRLTAMGVSVIYISQRLEEIFKICNTITVLRNGQNVSTMSATETSMGEVIRHIVGNDIKEAYPKRKIPIGDILFQVSDAAPSSELPGVSFTVRRGEIIGIYGHVGAGKTELARAIFGVDHLPRGAVFLDGKKLNIKSPRDAISHGLALVPEERRSQGLLPGHGVHRNISLAALASFQRAGLVNGKKELEVATGLIKQLRIKTPGPTTEVQYLSGGNQQKVVLAKWLTSKAKVFILDEPTAGIDVSAKVEIYRLIEDLAEQNAGIILISSELDEIMGISDRVLVMREGEIVFEGVPTKTTSNEVIAYSLGTVHENNAFDDRKSS